jgi:hypothetical protein
VDDVVLDAGSRAADLDRQRGGGAEDDVSLDGDFAGAGDGDRRRQR